MGLQRSNPCPSTISRASDAVGAITIEEARALLSGKGHADVIVCAAHFEEESMFEFLKRVRDREVHRATKFLILSLLQRGAGARLARSAASAGLLLGADSYAIMPVFDPGQLSAHIRTLQPRVPVLQQSAPAEGKRRAE